MPHPPSDGRSPAAPPRGSPPPDPGPLVPALCRLAACAAHPAEWTRLCRAVVEEASALGAAAAALAVPDGEAELRVAAGTGRLAWLEGEFLPLRGSFTGRGAHGACRTPALAADPDATAVERELGGDAAAALPLRCGGTLQGVLLLCADADQAMDLSPLELLGEVAAALLAGAAAYARRRRVGRASGAAPGEPALPADQLIRALRHEINNPLAVVTGHAQLLERDPTVAGAEPLLEAVRQIAEAGRRISELTGRLARAEARPGDAFVTADGGLGVADGRPDGS